MMSPKNSNNGYFGASWGNLLAKIGGTKKDQVKPIAAHGIKELGSEENGTIEKKAEDQPDN